MTQFPFIYGRPVGPERFIGRQAELTTLRNRILTGQSTAIVGDPHIGKTSLLQYLLHPQARRDLFDDELERLYFSHIDCSMLLGGYTPTDFWERALEPVADNPPTPEIGRLLRKAQKSDYRKQFHLEDLFRALGHSDRLLVLLLDEFDMLLHEGNGFFTPEFLGALRSIRSTTTGLSMVFAARMRLHQMNKRTEHLKQSQGSPFFNLSIECVLRPFSATELEALFSTALAGSGVDFSPQDIAFITHIAGHHPYLIQTAGAALFDAATRQTDPEARYYHAADLFRQWTASFFHDLWTSLSTGQKYALTLLAVGELQGRVDGRAFNIKKLGKLDHHRAFLHELVEKGLVETTVRYPYVPASELVAWEADHWHIATDGFVWWFADNIIARQQHSIGWEEWLDLTEQEGLLTRGQKKALQKLASQIPTSAVAGAGQLVGTFIGNLVKAR